MTNQELLDIIKIQADIINRLGNRILINLPPTPERQEIKEAIDLMNERLKSSE